MYVDILSPGPYKVTRNHTLRLCCRHVVASHHCVVRVNTSNISVQEVSGPIDAKSFDLYASLQLSLSPVMTKQREAGKFVLGFKDWPLLDSKYAQIRIRNRNFMKILTL